MFWMNLFIERFKIPVVNPQTSPVIKRGLIMKYYKALLKVIWLVYNLNRRLAPPPKVNVS